jgi:hypothetical protein
MMIWGFRLISLALGVTAVVKTVEWMHAATAMLVTALSTGGLHS